MIPAGHADVQAKTLQVDALQGANLLNVAKDVSLTVNDVAGSGVLTKRGEGLLKVRNAGKSTAVNVEAGTLWCEHGSLGTVTVQNGGTLRGSGRFGKVTVNNGTLVIGNSPGYRQYNGGTLTLNKATPEFSVDGLKKGSLCPQWFGLGFRHIFQYRCVRRQHLCTQCR